MEGLALEVKMMHTRMSGNRHKPFGQAKIRLLGNTTQSVLATQKYQTAES